AVQLHGSEAHETGNAVHVGGPLIDEQADRGDERRKLRTDRARTKRIDEPRALGPEHEADGVRTGLDRRQRVARARHAADLHEHQGTAPRAVARRASASRRARMVLVAPAPARSVLSSAPGAGAAMKRSPMRNAP